MIKNNGTQPLKIDWLTSVIGKIAKSVSAVISKKTLNTNTAFFMESQAFSSYSYFQAMPIKNAVKIQYSVQENDESYQRTSQ